MRKGKGGELLIGPKGAKAKSFIHGKGKKKKGEFYFSLPWEGSARTDQLKEKSGDVPLLPLEKGGTFSLAEGRGISRRRSRKGKRLHSTPPKKGKGASSSYLGGRKGEC